MLLAVSSNSFCTECQHVFCTELIHILSVYHWSQIFFKMSFNLHQYRTKGNLWCRKHSVNATCQTYQDWIGFKSFFKCRLCRYKMMNNFESQINRKKANADFPGHFRTEGTLKEEACATRQVPLLSSMSSSRESSERGSTGAWSTATLFWLIIFSFSLGLGFLRRDAVADKLWSWQSPDSVKQTPSWV